MLHADRYARSRGLVPASLEGELEYGWPEEVQAFRREVREFLGERITPGVQAEIDSVPPYGPPEDGTPDTPLLDEIVREVEQRGWLFKSLPPELGGEGASQWFQYVLSYEMRTRGVPVDHAGMTLFGPAILRFGTAEQQKYYIPRMWRREITLALGYSEPNAGTDLASLTTRARRDGDDYVISGQKIWTSDAHHRSHVWLAVRTDPEAPKHRGISVFIVPLDSPGIAIRPIWTMAGVRTNEVFWEDVRVPAFARIGEENRGWYVIANALDAERVLMGVNDYSEITEIWDMLLAELARERPDTLNDPAIRRRLSELLVEIRVHRSLLLTNASIVAHGEMPTKEASMVKVWGTELRHRLADTAIDLLGRSGALRKGSPRAPLQGRLDASYRYAPVLRFAGGTNEIQRNIIAQRGLGLPR